MPSERASALYRALLADIAGYLSDMEVPQKYIELVSDTASTDIKWVSDEEAKAMSETRSIAEWLVATCGAKFQTTEDKQQFDELTGRMFSRRERASDKDEAMFNAVMARIDWWGQCVRGKKVGFRDAMAPPEVGIVPQDTAGGEVGPIVRLSDCA